MGTGPTLCTSSHCCKCPSDKVVAQQETERETIDVLQTLRNALFEYSTAENENSDLASAVRSTSNIVLSAEQRHVVDTALDFCMEELMHGRQRILINGLEGSVRLRLREPISLCFRIGGSEEERFALTSLLHAQEVPAGSLGPGHPLAHTLWRGLLESPRNQRTVQKHTWCPAPQSSNEQRSQDSTRDSMPSEIHLIFSSPSFRLSGQCELSIAGFRTAAEAVCFALTLRVLQVLGPNLSKKMKVESTSASHLQSTTSSQAGQLVNGQDVQISSRSMSTPGSIVRRSSKTGARDQSKTHPDTRHASSQHHAISYEDGPEAAAGGPRVHKSPQSSACGSEQVDDSHITAGLLPLSAVLKESENRDSNSSRPDDVPEWDPPPLATHPHQREGSNPAQSDTCTVESFLRECGLAVYSDVLKSNGFDCFGALQEIRQEHLEALGFPLGHQLLLLRHLREKTEQDGESVFDSIEMAKLRTIRRAALELRFAAPRKSRG